MTKIEQFVEDVREQSVCYQSEIDLNDMSDFEIECVISRLYMDWIDQRRILDEQILENNHFSPNYFIYEAREMEAKAKLFYVKAYMMRMSKFHK